ncbi:hypothetical protein AVEN_230230-1 [Araneus ventricosus]|uniref:Uncharacterized protein n=1 Tax=Araneus ventricosus TaxID=182803 RepID=A0A4Y2DWB4_ARAVE|nr:hypothetical protein AVEN_230230-1 [Araneus ventricosus]
MRSKADFLFCWARLVKSGGSRKVKSFSSIKEQQSENWPPLSYLGGPSSQSGARRHSNAPIVKGVISRRFQRYFWRCRAFTESKLVFYMSDYLELLDWKHNQGLMKHCLGL